VSRGGWRARAAAAVLGVWAGCAGAPGGGPPAPPPAQVVQLNGPGELVDVEAALVPGHVVVVDFWAEWCGACVAVEAALLAAIADESRILVRKVHVGDGAGEVAIRYDAASLPYLRIYDRRGALRHALRHDAAFTAGAHARALLAEP
jgi:thiol-disulfide isomerase/thioredoxin